MVAPQATVVAIAAVASVGGQRSLCCSSNCNASPTNAGWRQSSSSLSSMGGGGGSSMSSQTPLCWSRSSGGPGGPGCTSWGLVV